MASLHLFAKDVQQRIRKGGIIAIQSNREPCLSADGHENSFLCHALPEAARELYLPSRRASDETSVDDSLYPVDHLGGTQRSALESSSHFVEGCELAASSHKLLEKEL